MTAPLERTVNPAEAPTVLTVSTINAGIRHNIIPDKAELSGTMRSFASGHTVWRSHALFAGHTTS